MSYPYQISSFEQYQETYKKSTEQPEVFWADIASHFVWKKKFSQVLDWNFETAQVHWFADGELNITENCLDRWVALQPDAPAIIWEPNDTNTPSITLTYSQLLNRVMVFANALKEQGVQRGDRVCIYMPMIPELALAVLACARIGAIHSVVFGGFSAQSIADRITDAGCSLAITANTSVRGNKSIPLKSIMDDALRLCEGVRRCIVVKHTNDACAMQPDRDIWWHDAIKEIEDKNVHFCEAEPMNAEDPLFILYTSGSTGKPKGVVHSTAGYMVYVTYSFVNVFQYQQGDIHFCTADVGWITGHSYILYGPLCAGATTLMFEGIPTYPDASRLWQVVEKHNVNILYTAPTAIRSLMSFGSSFVENYEMPSLKVLGSVGEPINEEAWHWFDTFVGKGRCPIVDTWWQTETGGILISNLAGITPQKPAHATLPLPGVQPLLVDELGNELNTTKASGNLCIGFPWPAIIRTTYGNHERCRQTYFSTYKNKYFTGDGCLRDIDGNYRITGRVDDVLNVSGHRIGTAEVENAINSQEGVIESAVVGFPHDIKGQGIHAFVILDTLQTQDIEAMKQAILATVTAAIGAIAKPDVIEFVPGLPKTRSGKIMRRILRKIAEGDISNLGDTSTLLDPSVVEAILKR